MRGLQNQHPSAPMSGSHVDPPFTTSSTTATTTALSNTQQPNINSTVEFLRAEQASFRANMSNISGQVNTISGQMNDIHAMLAAMARQQQPSMVFQQPGVSQPLVTFGNFTPQTSSSMWESMGLTNPFPSGFMGSSSFPQGSLFSTITASSPIFSDPNASTSSNTSQPPSTTIASSPQNNTYPNQQNTTYNQIPLFHFQPNQDMFQFKPPKMDLPRFYGDDAVGWLSMAERSLRSLRVPLHEKVHVIGTHLGPSQTVWLNALEQRRPNLQWDEFVEVFLEHFASGNSSDFKAQLSHLQQTASVDDFFEEFTKLSCRVPEWVDADLWPMFCGGLKHEIRHDVLAMGPRSLAHAHQLARRYEAKLLDVRASVGQNFKAPFWSGGPRPSGPSPAIPPTSTTGQTHPTPQPPNTKFVPQFRQSHYPTVKQWSPAEQKERRERNLCWTCDEPYHRGHVCKRPFLAILGGKRVTTWLVQWKGMPMEDATWEDAQAIVTNFPDFTT